MSTDVEFDRIAPIYDETRQPPSSQEVDALEGLLHGCRTVLDAGVGTGRFAVPLHERQFEIVGVDLSLGMMRRARAKGIDRLVRADVRSTPFADASLDAAFMAHVLQLLPDPAPVLRELGRVARTTVVVALPEWLERTRSPDWRDRRGRYRAIAAELGYPLPPRAERYHHSLEEVSRIARPREVRSVTRPPPSSGEAADRVGRWASGWFGGAEVPAEVHAAIVRRMLAERPVDPERVARARVTRFVTWSAADLRAPRTA